MADAKPPSETEDVFDAIRSACREVSVHARHVHVEVDRIPRWVEPWLETPLDVPQVDTTTHVVSDPPTTVAFFVTLAAVNFGSGHFPHLRKRPGRSGYFTVAAALKDRFDTEGPLSAEVLSEISPEDCARLFAQNLTHPSIALLMRRFAQSWNDLGRDLLEQYGGSFVRCVETADHSAARLVSLLSRQPFFRDVQSYRCWTVPFYKRSQLLASDLSLAMNGQGMGRFADLHRLTIFADNLVPHVLRTDGLLTYSEALSGAIAAEDPIPSGSEEEVELRACSVDCVERIVEYAASQGVCWTARDVDQVLWHRGQQPHIKPVSYTHLTLPTKRIV